ncbi:MAG: T9SS type A sorting domain-containing protein [Bacteroidales bacterium]|nr:T9SS type A sorting domain-containing protein [Bacteroidales bacterium]
MKKITYFVLMMAFMLSSVVIFAQVNSLTKLEKLTMDTQAQELLDLETHGPTVVVPYAPNEVDAIGDNCTTPIVVTIGGLPFSYSDLNQTTCGRVNDYSTTGLGYYDGGEDIIYQLDVPVQAKVTITMNPKGTTWTGLGLFNTCPPGATAIAIATGSSGTNRVITQILNAGTYYIMADTWPSPNCIPNFDLTIDARVYPMPGDLCTMPIAYGSYNDAPISGTLASGEAHWYSFTGPDLAFVTASLCNSFFDTQLDIWGSCSDGTYLYYNDDACGTQSEIADKPFPAGTTWYVKVYGYGTASGNYELNITGLTTGDISGHVYDGDGVPVANATVGVVDDRSTVTDATGAYSFLGLPSGPTNMYASKEGWNDTYATATIVTGTMVTQDFTLTRPSLTINPLMFDEIMNPNEYLTKFLGMLNIGDGPAGWSAEVVYPEVTLQNVETNPVANIGQTSKGKIPQGSQASPDSRTPQYLNPNDTYNAWLFGANGGSASTLYLADMGAYTYTTIGSSLIDPSSGDFMNNETQYMYCSGNWGSTLYMVDVTTGASTFIAPFSGGFDDVSGMSCDRTTNTMYVSMTNVSASQIGTVDLTTGVITPIGSQTTVAPGLIQIAIDGTGQMYGWDIVTNNSYTIDKTTGVPTVLGSLGFDPNYGQGGNWSQTDDVIYLSAFNASTFQGELRALDITTGGTTFLGVLPQLQCTAFGFPGGGGAVGGWLTLGQYNGEIGPNGTSFNLPVNFDATGTEAGQVYNAEIQITTNPNVGSFTVPVTMTIYGDPLSPVTDLTATLTDEVTGSVLLNWSFTRPVNFQYFLIKRNGLGIGTTTSTSFTNILPDFGNYCYTVTPVYDAGNGVPGGPACVDWYIPALCFSPATVENSQWPDVQEQVTYTMENCGEGTLAFEFPDYVGANRFACTNEIELRDSYGDGWNGGTISVFVNGTAVLSGVTLSSGAGPVYYSFPVNGGDLMTTDFVPGSWAYECNYKLVDVDRVAYYTSNPAADLLPGANVHAPCPVPSYITSVSPSSGTIAGGQSMEVTLTYNSDGFYVGDFPEALALNTNDPNNLETSIPNIMHVYQPASISGTVTDCVTGNPKKNVTVTANGWSAINEWLYYDNGVYATSIGGPATFSWAVKFDPAQLADVEGSSLTKIMLYNYVTAPGELRIYEGTNAATLLHTQTLAGLPVGSWSEVNLTSNVPIDVTKELWITVYTAVGATFPASCSAGMGQPNGDLITLDGSTWEHLTDYGLPYTWTLRGFVTNTAGAVVALPLDTPVDNYNPGSRTGLGISGVMENVPIPEELLSRVSESNTYTTETAENGTYTLLVDEGTYTVDFTQVGFHDFTVENVVVTIEDSPVDVDAVMCEMAYPVSFVYADPNEADTQALITWGIPMGPYSIIYDDGFAENYFSWLSAGSASAVKFTPAGYPATVIGGRMFVGDGSFPEGVDFLGAEVSVGVIAADGANGMPGTVLDSTTITVDNYGWVNFDNVFNTTIDAGNFYIAVWKLFTQVPVGVDQSVPTYYRSYVKPVGGSWGASSYQDFMIRAIVDGPGTNVMANTVGRMIYPSKVNKSEYISASKATGRPGIEGVGMYRPIESDDVSRELVDYAVARISGFDPNHNETPEDGTLTIVYPHCLAQSYPDVYGGLPAGFYAYAVRAQYSMENSIWVYSNIVAHGLDNLVTFNVSLCDGGDVTGAELHLTGHDYPYQHLMATTDISGVVVFDSVINGTYDLMVTKRDFMVYEHNGLLINYDYTEDVILGYQTYPPKNLFVEPSTSEATWESPVFTVEEQGFEDTTFPPEGWSMETNDVGFFRTNDGSSTYWTIPPGDGYYACANDDMNNGDASEDRLILPSLTLGVGYDVSFTFDYFYDGYYGGSAYVEYSLDNGANWTVLSELAIVSDWTTESIDISDFAGGDAITFCFHYDDNGWWADGMAVDNVSVGSGPSAAFIVGYEISLNNGYITEVGADVFNYTYRNLTYGQTYIAGVKAKYPCGVSVPATYTFGSTFLYPPVDLTDAYVYNTNEIPLMWFPPVTVAGPAAAVRASILSNNTVPAAQATTILSSMPSNGGSPEATRETVLNWDGDNADGLGLTAGGTWEVGAYFPASLVDPLAGEGITAVEVYIADLSSTFTIKVYDAGTPTLPGAVLYTQAFTPVEGWNMVTLDEPVVLSGEDVWVVYEIAGQPAGTYPAGFDAGPAVIGFGDWAYLNGAWDNVGNYGFGNFNVRAHVNPVTDNGQVPDGLLSFNLYQDGEILTNVPYADQAPDEYVNYVINPIDPGTYSYDVSAVYDLSVFGLTGTAESAWEGTDVVTVAWGFPLPFNEDFGQGSFDFNHWRFNDNGANWVINSQSGNGAPSAEFTWDPLLTDGYSSTMTSNPLLGDQITEGNIWLDFDLKLQDRNATGAEKMKVEVFNGSTWSQVALFGNEGSFDYTASHVNITAAAKGRVFQVRFNAIGENSFDVISWFVDNINIYRTCTPPTSLTGEYVYNNGNDFGAEVCWNGAAGTNVSEWLYYDDGTNVDGIGGPASFSWAVKFDPSQLEDFEGASLTKIKIVARTAAANELRIYEGTNAATLLHTQTLSGLPIEEWSEVELTSSVAIDITKQLWITVYTDDGANYPAGCGNGMNEPNGDLITLDGSTWEHLSDYALDYTWNLRGFVTTATGATASIPMEAPKDNYNNDSRATLAISGQGSTAAALVETAERAISGYNVYRKQVEVDNDYVLLTNVPAVQGTTHYCYYDGADIGCYLYQVTAAYSSETDACESVPGMALLHPTEDFVNVCVTDIASNEANVTRMYPNPANESVTIESSKMNRVIVMNTVGQVVYDVMANGANKVILNTATYEAGVYVVRIEAAEGTVTQRVTIVR